MKLNKIYRIWLWFGWEEINDLEKLAHLILSVLDESYLEKPVQLKIPNHQNTKPVNDYLDDKIMKYFLKKNTIGLNYLEEDNYLSLQHYKGSVTLGIFYNLQKNEEAIEQVKELFLKLIKIHQPYSANVHFGNQKQELKDKYRVFKRQRAKEHVRSRGLFWLNFWGPEELRRQGGQREVMKNKLARCTPLMQGLLIEVGDDPFELLTAKGEKLLMEASAALPEIELRPVPGA